MPVMLGDLIVIAALAAVVILAVRSVWRTRKAGGQCTGDCASCGGCRHGGQKK